MDARYALPVVSFLMADVGGGLGPFLSTWLAEVRHWTPGQVGTVVAAGSLAGALLATPAGSLVDRVGQPRLLLAAACAAILAGTLLLLPFEAFWVVFAAQIVVAAGGALGSPAVTGLTLSVVGRERFARQQGTNDAANHAGNVTAALMIGGLAWVVGPVAAVLVLVAMAIATIAVLWRMDPASVNGDRMRGRKRRDKGEKRGLTRALLKDRRIWILLAVVGLFQLGNSAMLPLLGQRVVAAGDAGTGGGTSWMSVCVIVAQLTMVPVAFASGRLADRFGARRLLMVACAVVVARCALAAVMAGTWWLVPIEVLDGVAAGVFSVTVPVAIANLTYGTGRTQTAIGAMTAMLAGGAALASLAGGFAVQRFGYGPAFATMAVFPAIAAGLLLSVSADEVRGRGQPGAGEPGAGEPGGGDGKAAAMSAAA